MNQLFCNMSLGYLLLTFTGLWMAPLGTDVQAQQTNRVVMKGGVVMKSVHLVVDLLEFEEVHKELDMSSEQIEALAESAKSLSGELKDEIREALITGTDFEELKKELQAREEKLLNQLSEKQQNRLKQLDLQRSGLGFWVDPRVQKVLEITAEQNKEIIAIREAVQQKAQGLATSGELFRNGRDNVMEMLEPLNKEGEAKILQLLTDEQEKKIEELKGQPFSFPKRMSDLKVKSK